MPGKTSKLTQVADIVLLPEIQIRIRVDKDLVEEYKDKILDGVDMDPIDVFVDEEGRKVLGDGVHRYMAYVAAEQDKIPAFIHDDNPKGALSEALEFSIERNGHHGKRLAIEDRKRAVSLALADKILRRRSDRSLSQLCGISPSIVKEIRQEGFDPAAPKEKKKKKADKKITPVPRVEGEPEVNTSNFEGRISTIKGWIRDGYIDWPAVAEMFETEKHIPVLWPKEVSSILLDNGKKKTRVPIKEQRIVRKGGDYFVEYIVSKDDKATAEADAE